MRQPEKLHHKMQIPLKDAEIEEFSNQYLVVCLTVQKMSFH